jgi:prevent-host-death family protein
MHWRVAEAKERFSEMLRAANEEPQLILNRNRVVAAVVDADTFREFDAWRQKESRRTMGDDFEELRRICAEEDYVLEVPPRRNRANAFVDAIDDELSR